MKCLFALFTAATLAAPISAIAAINLSDGRTEYEAPSGPVALTVAPDAIAVALNQSGPMPEGLIGKLAPATVTKMYGSFFLIEGIDPTTAGRSKVRSLLNDSQIVDHWLKAYRRDDGEIMVAYRKILLRAAPGLSEGAFEKGVLAAGVASVSLKRRDQRLYEAWTYDAEDTNRLALELDHSSLTMWAHPDFIYRKRQDLAVNDSYFSDQWHHGLIGSASAWDIEEGSSEVIIAIIDSGVDGSHPDLASVLVHPQDTLDEDSDATPDGDDAHGTAAAGLAAAITNNGVGTAGVCGQCKIMPIRILGESGFGRFEADSDAFYWAIDHGADVLSNSWGPAGQTSVPSNLNDAIIYATEEGRDGKGAVVLFAAGNSYRENQSYELPSHPSVIGVGATSFWERREDYSNWGAELDITAPAGSVTTDMVGNAGYSFGDYTSGFGGTSAACPVAAGVAGLILSVDAELTRGQVLSILRDSADKIGDVTYDESGHHPEYGFGRVNALRAVQLTSGGEVCQTAPEDCENGIDDDCDGEVDANDVSCIPETTQVGVGCAQDFQCGEAGFCLPAQWGYDNGYCSASCGSSCPGDASCIQTGNGGFCFDTCESRDDCREGYDCLDAGGASICQPSCTVSGCIEGEMCDETTGACYHDGPQGPAQSCEDDVECASDGRCSTNAPDGFCIVACGDEDDCTPGQTCEPYRWFSICADACQRNQECRDDYSCYPNESGDGFGVCWPSCESNDDCADGQACNFFGLCGFDEPPLPDVVEQEGAGGSNGDDGDADSCECDLTTACDDSCSCDPECGGGCSASDASSGWLWLGSLGLLAIRRRRTAFPRSP